VNSKKQRHISKSIGIVKQQNSNWMRHERKSICQGCSLPPYFFCNKLPHELRTWARD
jgi:hypothetical protein